jgi:hypothetical protein
VALSSAKRASLSHSCGCNEKEPCSRARQFIDTSDWANLIRHWQNTLEVNGMHLSLYVDIYGPRDRGRPRTKRRPKDYAPCPDCGYDHAYDPAHAAEWHLRHPSLDLKEKVEP